MNANVKKLIACIAKGRTPTRTVSSKQLVELSVVLTREREHSINPLHD